MASGDYFWLIFLAIPFVGLALSLMSGVRYCKLWYSDQVKRAPEDRESYEAWCTKQVGEEYFNLDDWRSGRWLLVVFTAILSTGPIRGMSATAHHRYLQAVAMAFGTWFLEPYKAKLGR
jgi:hypothetical protein